MRKRDGDREELNKMRRRRGEAGRAFDENAASQRHLAVDPYKYPHCSSQVVSHL